MYLGVLLNRVFRINNNPLFDYVIHNQDKIKKLYLIIPLEDLRMREKQSKIIMKV